MAIGSKTYTTKDVLFTQPQRRKHNVELDKYRFLKVDYFSEEIGPKPDSR